MTAMLARLINRKNPTATSIAAGLELLAVGFGKHVLHQVSGGPQAPRE